MPQIRPYISQQEAQTNNADTPSSPSDFGGTGLSNIGEGLQNLGEGVYRGLAAIKERESRDEVSKAHLDAIDVHNELAKEVNTRTNAWKPGDKSLSEIMPDVIKDRYGKRHLDGEGNSTYRTPAGQAAWAKLAAEGSSHVFDRLIGIDAHLAGEASKQSFADLQTLLGAGVSDDPYNFWALNKKGANLIRDPNGPYGNLSEVHKNGLVADLEKGNALAFGLAMAENNPNGLLSHLEDPRSPLAHLDPSVRAKLKDKADGTINTSLQQARFDQQEEHRLKIEAQTKQGATNLFNFMTNAKGEDGKLLVTPLAVAAQANEGKLDPEQARAFMNWMASDPKNPNKEANKRDANLAAYRKMYDWVTTPYGDPNRPNSDTEIYEKASKANLTIEQTEALLKDYYGGRTRKGNGLIQARNTFLKSIAGLITHANPAQGKDDPPGDVKLGEFKAFVISEERKRDEAGLNPYDLYNANHPDYIKHKIGPWQMTMQETIKATVDTINGKPKTMQGTSTANVATINGKSEPTVDPLRADPNTYESDPSRWGRREDNTEKGWGWFGMLKNWNGQASSELSTSDPIDASGKPVTHPLLVPTLTRKEIEYLLSGKKLESMEKVVREKAAAFARKRLAEGKSPYPGPSEQVELPPQGEVAEEKSPHPGPSKQVELPPQGKVAEEKSPHPGPSKQVELPPQGKVAEAAAAGPKKIVRNPGEDPIAFLKRKAKAAQ